MVEEWWTRSLGPLECLLGGNGHVSGGIGEGTRTGPGNSSKGRGKEARTKRDLQPTGRRVLPSGRGEGREGGGPNDPRRTAPGALEKRAGKTGWKAGAGKGKNLQENNDAGTQEEPKKGKGTGAEGALPLEVLRLTPWQAPWRVNEGVAARTLHERDLGRMNKHIYINIYI